MPLRVKLVCCLQNAVVFCSILFALGSEVRANENNWHTVMERFAQGREVNARHLTSALFFMGELECSDSSENWCWRIVSTSCEADMAKRHSSWMIPQGAKNAISSARMLNMSAWVSNSKTEEDETSADIAIRTPRGETEFHIFYLCDLEDRWIAGAMFTPYYH